MADVRAVLLIPADGDPFGLLRDGVCGAMPPTAWRDESPSRWRVGTPWAPYGEAWRVWYSARPTCRALVLAWEGEVVPEGIDRFCRVSGGTAAEIEEFLALLLAGADLRDAVAAMNADPDVTLVLLDADDREVTP